MTTQITIRLPDDLVRAMDAQVESGQARSRAAVVTDALLRDRRRRQAERDAEIYRELGEDPDLVAWSDAAASTPLDLD